MTEDTAPLPPVGPAGPLPPAGVDLPIADAPTERLPPVSRPPVASEGGRAGGARRSASPALRALEGAAGLLSGGLVVVGLALVALQFLAPQIAPGTGLAAASGPGWGRAGAQLAVGLAGEAVVLARRWCPGPVRAGLAAVVIAAVAMVLWFAWWA